VFPAFFLVLGSAKKNFAADKEVGVFTHQKIITTGSFFNNAYGILQDHWVRFVSAKHQTLIPTLP
jgi:hypothetical protein